MVVLFTLAPRGPDFGPSPPKVDERRLARFRNGPNTGGFASSAAGQDYGRRGGLEPGVPVPSVA